MRKSIFLSEHVERVLRDANLLKLYTISSLVNYSLSKTIPSILKEKNIFGVDAEKTLTMGLKQKERLFIIRERKEKMSKAYFLKRFIMRMRKLIDEHLTKKDIISVLKSYEDESKTYFENEDVTKTIQNYIITVEKTKNLDLILSYLDLRIEEIKENNYIAKNKNVQTIKQRVN